MDSLQHLYIDDDPDWASVHALIQSAFAELPATSEDDGLDDDDDMFPDEWYDEDDDE